MCREVSARSLLRSVERGSPGCREVVLGLLGVSSACSTPGFGLLGVSGVCSVLRCSGETIFGFVRWVAAVCWGSGYGAGLIWQGALA